MVPGIKPGVLCELHTPALQLEKQKLVLKEEVLFDFLSELVWLFFPLIIYFLACIFFSFVHTFIKEISF